MDKQKTPAPKQSKKSKDGMAMKDQKHDQKKMEKGKTGHEKQPVHKETTH